MSQREEAQKAEGTNFLIEAKISGPRKTGFVQVEIYEDGKQLTLQTMPPGVARIIGLQLIKACEEATAQEALVAVLSGEFGMEDAETAKFLRIFRNFHTEVEKKEEEEYISYTGRVTKGEKNTVDLESTIEDAGEFQQGTLGETSHLRMGDEKKKYFEDRLFELPKDVLDRAITIIQTKLHPEEQKEVAAAYEKYGKYEWIYHMGHHGWGTSVRNLLRTYGIDDQELPVKNWDDYYVQVIEVALGLQPYPSTDTNSGTGD